MTVGSRSPSQFQGVWILAQVNCTSLTVNLTRLEDDTLGSQKDRNVLWNTQWADE